MEECVASTPSLSPPSPMVKMQERQVFVASLSTHVAEMQFCSSNMVEWKDDYNYPELDRIAFQCTPAVLEEAFKSSGSIKRGTVQVSSNKMAKKSKEVLSKGGTNVSAKQLAVKVLLIKDIASMMDLQVVAMHANVVTTSSLATPRSVLNMQELQVTAAPPPIYALGRIQGGCFY